MAGARNPVSQLNPPVRRRASQGTAPHPGPLPARGERGKKTALADRILYRDGLILVIDKPAGLPVHGGPGGGPNLETHFDGLRFGLPNPPHLAHRLDRDTSGCLVLGRHPKALRRLGRLFAEGLVEKIYWAVVEGVPADPQGHIETGLSKTSHGRGWRMAIDPEGQRAATDYRVLAAAEGHAWLELKPATGRTHQIRVHCAALGTPVAGDPVYGRGRAGERLMLHARAIRLPLYPNRPPIAVEAAPPAHMLAELRRLGYDSEEPPAAREAMAR